MEWIAADPRGSELGHNLHKIWASSGPDLETDQNLTSQFSSHTVKLSPIHSLANETECPKEVMACVV